MNKHKKTREQKIISDLRRRLSLQAETVKKTIPEEEIKRTKELNYNYNASQMPVKPSTVIYTHEYLRKDLSKTAFLTFSIIAFELLLFLLFKNQILRLPFIGF